jgi:glutamyl-tRNA synthetase
MDETIQKMRVRFAPSPTGHLHVGGARTALYNWLLARGRGGTFVLRIEDTDLSRSTDEAIAQIISSMRWLGLDWDEGPEKGGPFGPYRQMERTDLYRDAADRLIASGKAYWCFCTAEELDAEREAAKSTGRAYVYSGKCLGLESEEVDRCLASGSRPVIRLRAPRGGSTVVHDLIHGDVTFENELIGDIILVRSNGVPTYNFAVAVDDAGMQITHVIRGDDHLPNTPKQLLVLKALGRDAPAYAHVPLILGPDKTPLSKRHGSASLEEFRAQGYVREAMCNFLALLGWSYDAETTIFSREELIEKFSLERVGSTPAVFDMDKLLWMNGHYIRAMDPQELSARIEHFLAGSEILALAGKDARPLIMDLVPMVQEKIKTLAEFAPMTDFFFLPVSFEEKAVSKLKGDQRAADILGRAAETLACLQPYSIESIEAALRAAAEEMDIKLGKFLQPIRIAVSGKTVTPGMFETLALLGREKSIRRINTAMELLEEG